MIRRPLFQTDTRQAPRIWREQANVRSNWLSECSSFDRSAKTACRSRHYSDGLSAEDSCASTSRSIPSYSIFPSNPNAIMVMDVHYV